MSKKRSKPKRSQTKPSKAKQSQFYSVNALSKLTGADRKTIDKAIARAQIKPARMVGARPEYRLEDVQAALDARRDKSLVEEKLAEEVRKLRIRNDRDEGKLIPRLQVNATIARTFGDICRMLDQKLENELPALMQGLDVVGARLKGKLVNDLIRAELRKLVEAWPE
jgi:hypothetical protein